MTQPEKSEYSGAMKPKNSAPKSTDEIRNPLVKASVSQNMKDDSTPSAATRKEGSALQGGVQVSTPVVDKRGKLLPAITVYEVGVKEIASALDHLLGRGTFQVRMIRRSVISIRARGLENFDRIKEMLRERKYRFHAHTPKPLVPYAVIVEGLSSEYSEEEVLEFFRTQVGFRVDMISAAFVSEDKWLLRVGRGTEIEKLYRLDLVLHCKVRFRKNRGREIVQCFNCQRFGHVASNCGMEYRCVKCGQSHIPGECMVPSKKEVTERAEGVNLDEVQGAVGGEDLPPISCANCGTEGHVASARDCPIREAILRKRAQLKHAAAGKARARSERLAGLRSGLSYAAATAGRIGSSNVGVASSVIAAPPGPSRGVVSSVGPVEHGRAISEDCQAVFGKGISELYADVVKFGPQYRKLFNERSRADALIGLLLYIGGLPV